MIWWLYFTTAMLVYLGMARHSGDLMLDHIQEKNPQYSPVRCHVTLHLSLIMASAFWFFALILVVIGAKKKK